MAHTYKSIDLSHYSTIGIGPKLNVLIIDEPVAVPDDHFILGHASNLLISNTPPPMMMLSKRYDYIYIENGKLIIGAMTPSGKIVSFCKKHDIAHFEFLLKLPAFLGGMVKMNAGLKEYEIFNHLKWVKTHKGTFSKDSIDWGYRHADIDGLILEAAFEIEKGFSEEKLNLFLKMRDNQPQEKSAGSCFANPKGDYAARLIEAVGLKGYQKGGMAFSAKHANFLVNLGEGTYEEAIFLIEEAKKRVKARFNIELREEIIRV